MNDMKFEKYDNGDVYDEENEENVNSRLREEFPDRVIASYSVMPSPKVL